MKAFIISGLPVLTETISEILIAEKFEIFVFNNNLKNLNSKIENLKPNLIFIDPIFIPGIAYPARKGGEYYQEILSKNKKVHSKIIIMYFFERITNKDKFQDIEGIIDFPPLSKYKSEINFLVQKYICQNQKTLVCR